MTTVLRDYQQEMLTKLNKAWKEHRSVMVQMPTGTGKTHLMAAVIKERIADGVLIVAHRRELLDQIRTTVTASGIDLKKEPIVVESIQKLSNGRTRTDTDNPSLVIVDEAHHALAKTYKMLWERWPKAKFLGLTATPCRLSGEAFTDLFDTLLQSWPIQEFIDKGWLSDFEYVSASPKSMMALQVRKLKKRSAGDYQEAEMATVLDVPESIQHLYDTYHQYADGKKGIIYAINIAHAKHISDYYQAKGEKVCEIDSKTPAEERQQKVEDYRNGKIDILVSVDLFGEGIDCPEVEVIQLARPTLSLSKYLQQVGRGMRVSEGKPHVLILDNVGLYQTLGLPTEERDWKRMFQGQAPGKGLDGRIVLADGQTGPNPSRTERDKELVNLEMVRIKQGGRKGAGLEVFLNGGLYGFMYNGKVTCPARFKEIVRIDNQSQFFALAIYTEVCEGKSKRIYEDNYLTVINKFGMDLGARFSVGSCQIAGDFVGGYRGSDVDWWDSKTGIYYGDMKPEVKVIHGMEFVYTNGDFKFRHLTGSINPEFYLSKLYYNKHIALDTEFLVVRSKPNRSKRIQNEPNHVYQICGFKDNSIYVKDDKMFNYLRILPDGTTAETLSRLPQDLYVTTSPWNLGVKRIEENTMCRLKTPANKPTLQISPLKNGTKE